LQRWVTFLVTALGGGLGWIFVVQKQFGGDITFPLDLYMNEANTLLTIMAFPHQAMATGLLVATLGLAALAFERDSLRPALLAGLLAVVLGVQHGYDLLVVYGVVGSTALVLAIRSRRWVRMLGLGAAVCAWSVPVAGYLTYLTTQSTIWRGVLAQYGNAGVFTPTPDHLLILMGLPLFAVLIGLPGLLRGSRQGVRHWFAHASALELLLGLWLGVGFLLLYVPTSFQIKMLAGWQVPVGVIATRVVLERLPPYVRQLRLMRAWRAELVVGVLFVLAVLPANAYLYAWRFVDLRRAEYPYYLNRDDVAGLRWLEANSRPSDVVLSSLTVGEFVPSMSGNTAFLAHWAQTLDFFTKRRLVVMFFDPQLSDDARRDVLMRYDVRYVFYGEEERKLGAFDPNYAPYLVRVFSSPATSVYVVSS
jgi:hypothetical protein